LLCPIQLQYALTVMLNPLLNLFHYPFPFIMNLFQQPLPVMVNSFQHQSLIIKNH